MSENEDEYGSPFQQQMEAQQIMNESVSHELHLWLETLSNDALDKVAMTIHASINYPAWGAQMVGIIQGMRRFKYGVCPVCSKNHEAEKQEAVESEHARMVAEGTPIPGTPFKMGDAAALEEHIAGLTGRPFPEYLRLCSEFNVKSNIDQNGVVYCRSCNMPYPNLDDRMINPPDHCSGCYEFGGKGIKHPEPPK